MENNWEGKYGPLLIAEIGGNHEGDFEYAKKLTQLAIDSKADFVKYQLYSGDTLVSQLESPVRNKHFKKFELAKEQHIELAKMCQEANVGYMASVWDEEMMHWIDPYMPIYKIGSGDMTAYPILKIIAKKGKPIILSTGVSTLKEIIESVHYIQSVNPIYKDSNFLSILQCTSMYPIEFKDANLGVMDEIKKATGLTVGYSDHTIGMKALEISVAMGAQILEFHFTDTREGKEFRDHKVSLTKEEVHALISKLEDINTLKGNGNKRPLEVEGEHRTSFRRAIYPLKDLKAGTVFSEEYFTTLRPNHGIDAREFENMLGKTLKVDIKQHQRLEFEMFD